jgi:hypothetical protein
MFRFLRRLHQIAHFDLRPNLLRDFDEREPELYSWRESPLGHIYISNKNRKVLYRIVRTDGEFYRLERLNGVPTIVGTFLDLDEAKKAAEKSWDNRNVWIS